jgi:hypothetical protein
MRHVGFWLGWWIALFWLWLLISGDWNRIEIVAAACAAALGASIAEVGRSRAAVEPRVPLRWLAPLWKVPYQIVVDFGLITVALVRRREGVFRSHPFPAAAEGQGARALAVWAANFSPNAYVIEAGDERVLFHDLIPNRGSEEPA